MNSPSSEVPLLPADESCRTAAAALAAQWGLACPARSDAPLQLIHTGERLELRQCTADAPGPVYVDFVGGAVGHRRRFGGGRGQEIARAVGLKQGATPHVLDATAGLGRDAFVLASLGCTLTLVERSPVVAALLADGLRRAAAAEEVAEIIRRMRLVHADAAAWLAGLPSAAAPDVVYLDPMYPHRAKAALVKKEMRLFREVVGADRDAERLLETALKVARVRVVVKRPDYAEPLGGRPPTMSIATKNHRFDVYVIKALNP